MPEEKPSPEPEGPPAPAKGEKPERAPKRKAEEKEEPKAPKGPKKLEGVKEDFPHGMVNRPKDWETGVDLHAVGADGEIRRRDDINRMKMIRSYKGGRHETGQKVRGQRTRSNGRTGLTVGVTKKAALAAAQAKKAEEAAPKKEEKKEEKKEPAKV